MARSLGRTTRQASRTARRRGHRAACIPLGRLTARPGARPRYAFVYGAGSPSGNCCAHS